ncbi:hypothetical protein [Rhodopirellula sp. P2]|uniref:hypothetical protein n=1 Tax=Rhodopirellula sp. P2 TaxID=2127060 RepID=UPI0023674C26|nr:hypothetical protein [Rhodopirellula sp. P2]WDQ15877.1 hypothetical protein PSR62_19880 [Rhodopirellula sp. P2]
MPKLFVAASALIFCLCGVVGCGPNNEVTVSEIDDSVVQTEEQMAEMEAANAADMMSK